jgi:SAM-dependent MidA family methyltransferase
VAVRVEHADGPRPWSQAWAEAAYGAGGFYSRPAQPGPSAHFRTSVHVGAAFHRAIATLLVEVDERLGSPPRLDLVDVGAGRGELAAGVLLALPVDVAARTDAVAIDLRPRPDDLDPRVRWIHGAAPDVVPRAVTGLLVAHEWLDDVPLDIVEVDPDGHVRLVLVDRAGIETLGPRIEDDDAWTQVGLDAEAARDWLGRWWSIAAPGERAELGLSRDVLGALAVRRLARGTLLGVDYGHVAGSRPRRGTLTAYAAGRPSAPAVPDGSANLTAHVALDSLAAATGGRLTSQREALLSLGVDPSLPDATLAAIDPVAYAIGLATASDASELLDPAGLGGFGWLRVDVAAG